MRKTANKIIKYGELIDSAKSSIQTTLKYFPKETERINRYARIRNYLVNRLIQNLKIADNGK